MTTITIKNGVAALVLALATVTACSTTDSTDATTTNGRVYGAASAMGNGTARVYVDVKNGVPAEIGVVMSEAALTGLEDHMNTGGMPLPDGHRMFEHVLSMPEANATPFRNVVLGWNPGGHEPAGIYDQPHFDFHFYTISEAARQAINPADPQFDAKAANHPENTLMPVGYVPTPGAVPLMGAHWINPTRPELNGQLFTKTFIFGSWNGDVIFAEPMITKAFLESHPDFSAALPIAEKQVEQGYYPASYSIRWDEKTREYRIALTNLTLRTR